MTAIRSIAWALGFMVFAFALHQSTSVASHGELDQPAFGFPESFSAAARSQIMRALQRTDCKFLGGTSHTTRTTLRYEGETVPLNLFLKDLAACPGITLSFRFNTPENANYDWTVEQDGFRLGDSAQP